jgi:hypothetical protein
MRGTGQGGDLTTGCRAAGPSRRHGTSLLSSRPLQAPSARPGQSEREIPAPARRQQAQRPVPISSGQGKNRQGLPVSTFPRHGMGSPPVRTLSDARTQSSDKRPSLHITRTEQLRQPPSGAPRSLTNGCSPGTTSVLPRTVEDSGPHQRSGDQRSWRQTVTVGIPSNIPSSHRPRGSTQRSLALAREPLRHRLYRTLRGDLNLAAASFATPVPDRHGHRPHPQGFPADGDNCPTDRTTSVTQRSTNHNAVVSDQYRGLPETYDSQRLGA